MFLSYDDLKAKTGCLTESRSLSSQGVQPL